PPRHRHLPSLPTRRSSDLLSKHCVNAGEFPGRRAAEQVVEREHRVSLAAAEIGLELHDRITALTGQALYAADQKAFQALRQKGRSEEHTSELQSRENLVCR